MSDAHAARILVCDDEPQILRALRVILRDAGFEAVTAATGEEALDLAAVKPPEAAILDLMLPAIDGGEGTRRLADQKRVAARLETAPPPPPGRRGGEPVHLTPIEFSLLRTLVRNRGR